MNPKTAPDNRRVLIVGSKGMLAQAISKHAPANAEVTGLDLPDLDITDAEQVGSVVERIRPDVIINCAAYTNVDGAESNEELATRVNGEGVANLAAAAAGTGAVLVHVSTDYVFSGEKVEPYTEVDTPGPLSAYGRSKLAGEKAILDSPPETFYIVRTSWLYGSGGRNFVETMLRLARERDELRVVADQVGSPTFTEDLARGINTLLEAAADSGIYHFSNSGTCSWHGFAEEIVRQARERWPDVIAERVVPIRTDEYPLPAPRPKNSVLSLKKYIDATGIVPPEWKDALRRYLDACETD